ncbi:hypothetical protein RCO28_25410 [Streptomyces sp. LHD-70]|uniref:hypothetical protein n=1 Tax=Streptomyces sp. LHD-70 TaxID=3072140 RepID=UPI00280FDFE6|nr:hypothetical protein [Streptomyces sp. LHD-70]MDQ8705809.1 hypothetical protein [Streptomyces sp. LHD-70]
MHRLGFVVRSRSHRFRLERLVAGRSPGRGALLPPPAHLSLRDSRTLNLALDPPEPVGRARLVLSRGGVRHEVPLAVERLASGGGRLLTATVTLRGPGAEPGASGLRLADGVWRLTVVTTGPEGRVRRRGLALAPEVPQPATPTLRYAPDSRTGALLRLVRCRGGRAALQVTRPLPHAELVRFAPRGDGGTVHGRLVAAPPEGWRAEAVRRRDGVVVPAQVTWRGSEFSLDLPLGGMTGAGAGQWVWDFRLVRDDRDDRPDRPDRPLRGRATARGPRVAARRELPLARRLTDVRDPATAFPAPFRVYALPCGSLVRAHAHFTKSGAFAVTCLELTEGR